MRALVTGATGFVGRSLVPHLEAQGDEVVAFGAHGEGGIDVLDPRSVADAVEGARPDVVYHLAGWSQIGESWGQPQEVFRVNAEGTLNILAACHSLPGVRVVVIGSADEYGLVTGADLPLTEDSPLRPITPYGASKVAADFLALQAFLGEGLHTIRVRAFNHIGPGQSEGFVVPAVAKRVVESERSGGGELAMGSLDPVRDFTDVRDVVRAYRLLAQHGKAGEAYNVCSGVGRSIHEIVGALAALATVEVRPVTHDSLVRAVEVPVLVGDASKLRATTGWSPEIPFEQTIADVLDEWRSRP